MKTTTITDARARLYALVDQVNQEHEELLITGKRGDAVLISADDWRSIVETLHLESVPGLVESIKEADKEPIEECIPEDELEW